MRVLVALSGGVDSSVAAALLAAEGHEVVGVTMKLWGGRGDSGCCSVGDVEDARRVAEQLGIVHHVFNLTDDFEAHVVGPYVAAHAGGRTPNPCIECNRHLKFDRLLRRARRLGFDALATGHHARLRRRPSGSFALLRGVDVAKDQSYVLSMLGQGQLRSLLLPVGELTKARVRAVASGLRLRTAAKPDSLETCFITRDQGRRGFLAERIDLRPGRLLDAASGEVVGSVPAVELLTVGQRRGLGLPGGRRYVVSVDAAAGTAVVGGQEELLTDRVQLRETTWASRRPGEGAWVMAQASAHGRPVAARIRGDHACFASAQRRVAPGQTVALSRGEEVVGSGIAC
ncbi:MAG: tRNA 2-thiouridine(34) synthase MnmA [Acidimicrobiales bacterium]